MSIIHKSLLPPPFKDTAYNNIRNLMSREFYRKQIAIWNSKKFAAAYPHIIVYCQYKMMNRHLLRANSPLFSFDYYGDESNFPKFFSSYEELLSWRRAAESKKESLLSNSAQAKATIYHDDSEENFEEEEEDEQKRISPFLSPLPSPKNELEISKQSDERHKTISEYEKRMMILGSCLEEKSESKRSIEMQDLQVTIDNRKDCTFIQSPFMESNKLLKDMKNSDTKSFHFVDISNKNVSQISNNTEMEDISNQHDGYLTVAVEDEDDKTGYYFFSDGRNDGSDSGDDEVDDDLMTHALGDDAATYVYYNIEK